MSIQMLSEYLFNAIRYKYVYYVIQMLSQTSINCAVRCKYVAK